MKKTTLLLLLMLPFCLMAQQYPVTSITINLPQNPDANTSKWSTGTSMLNITSMAKMVNGRIDPMLEGCRILVSIKKSGALACGSYNSNTAPQANFTSVSKVWSGNAAVSLLGQDCTLSPGEYELCVRFFGGPASNPLSEEKCKSFSIRAPESVSYQAPQLILPTNKSSFQQDVFKKAFTFRWTPLLPKSNDKIIYRLRLWQTNTNSAPEQITRSNNPVLEKDIENNTMFALTGAAFDVCPPYCYYLWNVQTTDKEGKPIGPNNGMTETFTFFLNHTSNIQPIKLKAPANKSELQAGKQVIFSWEPPVADIPVESFKISIVEIKGDQSPAAAFRTNKPFFEKDSIPYYKGNKPFFEKDSISAIRTNKPHFEKDSFPPGGWFIYENNAPKLEPGKTYAWRVQAKDKEGKGVGPNGGASEEWVFKMSGYGIEISDLKVGCAKDTVYNFSVKITNPNNATAILDKLELVMVNGAMITPINITGSSPPIGTTISPNGVINITSAFFYNGTVSNVCIKGYIKDQARPLLNSANSYICDTLPCCDPCSFNKVEVVNNSATASGNNKIKLTNTITANTSNITKIQADIVYVKIKPKNNTCNQCNKNQEQQNHFTGSNIILNGSSWKMNGAGAASHNSTNDITRSLKFVSLSPGGVNISSGIKINHTIGISPISCCGDEIEIWIRYTVWNKECYVCDKLVKALITRNQICGDGDIDIDK